MSRHIAPDDGSWSLLHAARETLHCAFIDSEHARRVVVARARRGALALFEETYPGAAPGRVRFRWTEPPAYWPHYLLTAVVDPASPDKETHPHESHPSR